MHTDHAFIDNVPGFLQLMFQAQGSVVTRVCDGLAVAEELRRTEPEVHPNPNPDPDPDPNPNPN